jgi:alkylation response protein AidB-like acyl-CoA dehydrogenase
MSEARALLADTADRVMAGAGEAYSPQLWRAIADAGLDTAMIAEDKGGSGADLGDAMAILRAAGRHALVAPLAETMLGAWLLSEAGLERPEGPLTVAQIGGDGAARSVPWAREAAAIVAVHGTQVTSVAPERCAIEPASTPGQEPRYHLRFANAATLRNDARPCPPDALLRMGALARSAQMTGALEAVLDMTARYAGERQQFGRPIGKFQAIQQQIADLAAHVSAASVACDAAAAAAERGDGAFAIAVAKARISEAAGHAAAIAHQVHGAIGFAREHALHRYTTRLWTWREDFGDESYWWSQLGRAAAQAGGEGLWSRLTETCCQPKDGTPT